MADRSSKQENSEQAAHEVLVAPASTPAFRRRAIVSDIMTWHYETPARLALHLQHDRAFIPWMAAHGLNAFFYIRHTVDSHLKLEELAPLLQSHGIASEYGGHVLPLLLPREHFSLHPEYFPVGGDGARNVEGNLCISNPAALKLVRDGALGYIRENPECALLHVWGADVWEGAWCRCAQCATLSPQLQYLKVMNAVADATTNIPSEVAYLAYHDTIDPDPGLQPSPNVSFEWAPRERCYSHAIDDLACATNPRYFDSLKRYLDLFDGRAHVFEYYADAILFGGLAVTTPSVIVRDLEAYRGLGITSISCLTFGEHSLIAYPINLATFARATHAPNFEPEPLLTDLAAELNPRCGSAMAPAYRAIAEASALILNGGGDVMRPKLNGIDRPARIAELAAAHAAMSRALDAADHLIAATDDRLAAIQRELWQYNRAVITGLVDYLRAADKTGLECLASSDRAIQKIADAISYLQAAAPAAANTWAAYDLDWIKDIWLTALHRRFGEAEST